jgi:hypothetical protein
MLFVDAQQDIESRDNEKEWFPATDVVTASTERFRHHADRHAAIMSVTSIEPPAAGSTQFFPQEYRP